MKLLLLVLPICLLAGCAATPDASKNFNRVSDTIWEYRQAQSPFSADPNSDDPRAGQLPDLSAEKLHEEYEQTLKQLQLLADIDVASLSEQEQINHVVLTHRLQNIADEYRFKSHQMPLTAEGGFHTSLAFLPSGVNVKSKQSLLNYIARLKAFPKYFDQQIKWMNEGLKKGNSQPKAVLAGYDGTIKAFITKVPTESVYYRPFTQIGDLYSEPEIAELQNAAQLAISDFVVPSYKRYLNFFNQQYFPQARDTIGVKYTPNGSEFYQNRALHYTTTNMSVEEIHQKGLQEVARIRAEMQSIIEQVNFSGSFSEFLAFLRTDPQFYAKTPEELLMRAAYLSKKMDAKLPQLFKHLPRTPYGVARVPDHIAPKYTTGRYVGASKDTDAGYYWVNTYALERRPLYELEALTLHEAVPGHHLQISLSREMTDTPAYRSNYYMSAFGEGWGLYAEKLGLEAGFYEDPYSNFGRLTYEMWRACRLVVDTGMHMKDWTRQQSIDYMKANTALSEHNIETEIDRYISWPAQALSYKIGELTISRLRQEAERQLGDKFDIREFHYTVLKNGSVPLLVLEKQIQKYISNTKQKESL